MNEYPRLAMTYSDAWNTSFLCGLFRLVPEEREVDRKQPYYW